MGAEPGQRRVHAHGVLLGGQLPPLPALEDEPQQPQQGQAQPGVHHVHLLAQPMPQNSPHKNREGTDLRSFVPAGTVSQRYMK